MPFARLGSGRKSGLKRTHDGADLMVADADQHGASMMGSAALEPLATDTGKVGGVERHEDPPLACGKLQQFLVRAAVESALLIDRQHVVSSLTQGRADSPAGDVRVEQ